jgi:hypothetical protein
MTPIARIKFPANFASPFETLEIEYQEFSASKSANGRTFYSSTTRVFLNFRRTFTRKMKQDECVPSISSTLFKICDNTRYGGNSVNIVYDIIPWIDLKNKPSGYFMITC